MVRISDREAWGIGAGKPTTKDQRSLLFILRPRILVLAFFRRVEWAYRGLGGGAWPGCGAPLLQAQLVAHKAKCHLAWPLCPGAELLVRVRVLVALRPIQQRDVADGRPYA